MLNCLEESAMPTRPDGRIRENQVEAFYCSLLQTMFENQTNSLYLSAMRRMKGNGTPCLVCPVCSPLDYTSAEFSAFTPREMALHWKSKEGHIENIKLHFYPQHLADGVISYTVKLVIEQMLGVWVENHTAARLQITLGAAGDSSRYLAHAKIAFQPFHNLLVLHFLQHSHSPQIRQRITSSWNKCVIQQTKIQP